MSEDEHRQADRQYDVKKAGNFTFLTDFNYNPDLWFLFP